MSKIIKTEAYVTFRVKVQIGLAEEEDPKECIEQIINEAEDLIHAYTNGDNGRKSFINDVETKVETVRASNAEKFEKIENPPQSLIVGKPDFDCSILGFGVNDTIE